MAQSLSKIYVHLIFSTKDRERSLPDEVRLDLHAYMGGTLKGLGCAPIEINSEPDHLHACKSKTFGPISATSGTITEPNPFKRSSARSSKPMRWSLMNVTCGIESFSRPFRPQ